jgi:hypothetical protein
MIVQRFVFVDMVKVTDIVSVDLLKVTDLEEPMFQGITVDVIKVRLLSKSSWYIMLLTYWFSEGVD